DEPPSLLDELPPLPQTSPPQEPIDSLDLTSLVLSIALPLALALLIFLLFRQRASPRTKLILFGPPGSGKTALYLQLKNGSCSPTVTSMKPSTSTVLIKPEGGAPSKSVVLTDAPGSGRLRGHLLTALPGTAALVCVIDGTALPAHAKGAAGMLYDVLTHEAIERRPPPLLVLVNKSDQSGAATASAARKQLEAEVSRVRLARTTMQAAMPPSRPWRVGRWVRGSADERVGE
ncbi:MAG: hypothetical protein SGPRY_008009, partial [Prymnesium sp.]